MSILVEGLVAGLAVIGGLFGLIASFGLWRLRHPMQRLHAPTKAGTLGLGAVLTASFVQGGFTGGHELLVLVFVIMTAPVSAMFLAKVHLHKTLDRQALPPTGTGKPWATFDVPGAGGPSETVGASGGDT